MAIILNPKKPGIREKLNLQTTTNVKQSRVSRVRGDLDRVYTEAETKARAGYFKIPYIDLYGFPIDTNHLIFMSQEQVETLKIGVFSIRNKEVYFASPHPGYEGQIEYLKELTNSGWTPKVHLCSEISFSKIIQTYSYVVETHAVSDEINLSSDLLAESGNKELTLEELGKKLKSVSISQFLETVLVSALNSRASDIHFEPEKESYQIRLRIDGILHTIASLPISMVKNIESRLKIVSRLKLNVDNVPQDGRFSFKANQKDIDVRVSMLPSNYGYSVVMRLLGTGQVALTLDALGFSGLAKTRIDASLSKPQGMILTTGPTGSGKTTTLYTFLSHLNDGQSKIITLEDPVEYKLNGVSQTQIDVQAGYTFEGGLRSILRQDPDVVMVGEIRDHQTADVAVQASLTGHQVLSTVHTNDAAGAIPRLVEMEIEAFLLADSLSAIIGQRLVRRVCEYCKESSVPTDDQKARIAEELGKISPEAQVNIPHHLSFVTGRGCSKCSGLGYKGRVGVYEVMTVTDGLRSLLSQERISTLEVRQAARDGGMITMFQDGIFKALEGLTSLDEVFENVG